MEGERSDDPSVSWQEDPLAGIIPRAMFHIFERLQRQVKARTKCRKLSTTDDNFVWF